MNALLNLSRGRYFTWFTDNDLYTPNFMAEVGAGQIRSSGVCFHLL